MAARSICGTAPARQNRGDRFLSIHDRAAPMPAARAAETETLVLPRSGLRLVASAPGSLTFKGGRAHG